jgi:hypothetical protein
MTRQTEVLNVQLDDARGVVITYTGKPEVAIEYAERAARAWQASGFPKELELDFTTAAPSSSEEGE